MSENASLWSLEGSNRFVEDIDLRSGFGVSIPLTDGILGYCRNEREAPDTDHIFFLGASNSMLARTMRSSSFLPDEQPATITASGSVSGNHGDRDV
jgi:hypothetical protein